MLRLLFNKLDGSKSVMEKVDKLIELKRDSESMILSVLVVQMGGEVWASLLLLPNEIMAMIKSNLTYIRNNLPKITSFPKQMLMSVLSD